MRQKRAPGPRVHFPVVLDVADCEVVIEDPEPVREVGAVVVRGEPVCLKDCTIGDCTIKSLGGGWTLRLTSHSLTFRLSLIHI